MLPSAYSTVPSLVFLRAFLIATVPFGCPIQITVSFRFEMVETKWLFGTKDSNNSVFKWWQPDGCYVNTPYENICPIQ